MKRLIKAEITKDVANKAKELCKSMYDALKKNDRTKLMKLKDEFYLYHPEIAWNDNAYRALIFKKEDVGDFKNKTDLEKKLRKMIYLDGNPCSFAKTLKGAEAGCRDWNTKEHLKDSYIVILKQKVNGIQLNKIAEICESMFNTIKEDAKDLDKKTMKKSFDKLEKEMKGYHSDPYKDVDEVVAVLDKSYKIAKILDNDK